MVYSRAVVTVHDFSFNVFLLEKNDKIFLGIIVCYTLGMSIMPIISSRVELFSHSLNIFYIRVLPFMTGAYYAKKTFSGLFVREENLEKWKEYLLIGLTYLIVLFALNDRFNAFNTWKKLYIQRMIFSPFAYLSCSV